MRGPQADQPVCPVGNVLFLFQTTPFFAQSRFHTVPFFISGLHPVW